jgi:molybdopterin synthase catalytic subunit
VRVSVRLFAGLRERAGVSRLELDDVPRVDDVWARLDLGDEPGGLLYAVNREYVERGHELQDGDEVAVIPPVSGGSPEVDSSAGRLFKVVEAPLDVNEVIRVVEDPAAGATVSFIGTVRDNSLGKEVVALDYEAYPAAAEKMMARVADEIEERWGLRRVAIIHRVGHLAIGEASVVIAVSSPHRHEAFAACEYVITRLKEIVPIWKKEAYTDGAVWLGSEADYPRGAQAKS